MIFDANQQFINYQINELRGKINKIYIKDNKKAALLTDELKEIETKAIIEASNSNDDILVLNDASKDIKDALNILEDKIDNVLSESNNNEISLDSIDEVISIKELSQAFKNTNPNLLQLNKFNEELIKKILKLLDRKKITINDIRSFYDEFNIQLVKNSMFEYKSNILDNEELMIFSNQLDKINNPADLDKLFELFLGISYPKEDETTSDINYPTAFKKSASKLVFELAEIVYGENLRKADLFKSFYNFHKESFGLTGDIYTIFTKSHGIVTLEERKIKELEEKNELFEDAIGCICVGRYFGHPKMENLKFLYVLNKKAGYGLTLYKNDLQNLEYVYATYIEQPYIISDTKAPNLKEICFEKSTSDFSADKIREYLHGDYKIVAENSNKLLKKILK